MKIYLIKKYDTIFDHDCHTVGVVGISVVPSKLFGLDTEEIQ